MNALILLNQWCLKVERSHEWDVVKMKVLLNLEMILNFGARWFPGCVVWYLNKKKIYNWQYITSVSVIVVIKVLVVIILVLSACHIIILWVAISCNEYPKPNADWPWVNVGLKGGMPSSCRFRNSVVDELRWMWEWFYVS